MSRAGQPIAPPATIGILGGGQLGRYAVIAARTAGYGTVVLDPDANAPAGAVADLHIVAAYDDAAALDELARHCAVITTEFENPPAEALQRLARDMVVAPPVRAVAIAQDRIAEKAFLERSGFPVAPCAALVDDSDLRSVDALGVPLIVKTARLGYDGKGQMPVDDPALVRAAWTELGGVPCLVERRVPLDVEVSVVLARGADGASVAYPVTENVHRHGILDLSVAPARIDASLAAEAEALSTRIADALDYVGVLAVEMFVSRGRLLVNELAPRPHNSGHWTLDAARTSQFAQQVRTATRGALGSTAMTSPAVAMVNLLGDLWLGEDGKVAEPRWAAVLTEPTARLHLYGKKVPRPGRKMGHLTVLSDDVDAAVTLALSLRDGIRAETHQPNAGRVGDDGPMAQPPERIEVPAADVVLRRHQAADVDALQAMIESSRDHLRPFMPWADQDRDATATFVAKSSEGWASGDNYNYLITEPGPAGNGERLLGGCGLHRRGGPETIEIGYWLSSDALGRGVMTEAARALTTAALNLDGIARVEIRCDVANTRSAAIPRRLGFVHVGDEDHEPEAHGESGRRQIWVHAGLGTSPEPVTP